MEGSGAPDGGVLGYSSYKQTKIRGGWGHHIKIHDMAGICKLLFHVLIAVMDGWTPNPIAPLNWSPILYAPKTLNLKMKCRWGAVPMGRGSANDWDNITAVRGPGVQSIDALGYIRSSLASLVIRFKACGFCKGTNDCWWNNKVTCKTTPHIRTNYWDCYVNRYLCVALLHLGHQQIEHISARDMSFRTLHFFKIELQFFWKHDRTSAEPPTQLKQA